MAISTPAIPNRVTLCEMLHGPYLPQLCPLLQDAPYMECPGAPGPQPTLAPAVPQGTSCTECPEACWLACTSASALLSGHALSRDARDHPSTCPLQLRASNQNSPSTECPMTPSLCQPQHQSLSHI